MTSEAIVAEYFARGYRVVLWPAKDADKGPNERGWTKRITTLSDYKTGMRVGLMTGVEVAPGHFLHDVDIDWAEGGVVAQKIIPPTRFVYGRATKRISHCFYTTPTPILSFKYEDLDNTSLLELRGVKQNGELGFQSMVPPSQWVAKDNAKHHEILTFFLFEDPAHLDTAHLQRKVANAAISMLFARHLGKNGFGHEPRLAWAGFMLKLGFEVEELVSMGEAISLYCDNLETGDVRTTIETTVRRLQDPKAHTRGGPTLAKFLGTAGEKVLQRIKEWLGVDEDFILTGKGKIHPNAQENIRRAFNKLGVTLSFDTFAQKALIKYQEYEGALQDRISNRIRLQIETQFHFLPQDTHYQIVVEDTAFQNAFHPVVDYLKSLTWDGTPRVNEWVIRSAGAADTEYTRAVSGLMLLAAVKRVLSPGCKFDEMLVLESGTQGLEKSSALRALCHREEWFSDDLPLNLDAKQIVERTLGKWIIEASDLSGMSPRNVEHLKAMMSRQVDGPVRMAYGHFPVEQPRQWVLFGTTNTFEYLSDVTGNRRFWPVRISTFVIEWIREHRDQLWAEAYQRVQGGESIRLSKDLYAIAGLQQERRRATDPWESILGNLYDNPKLVYRLPMEQIWEALGITPDRQNANDALRISKVMQLLGFRRMTVSQGDGKIVKGWGKGTSQRGLPIIPQEDNDHGD